MIREAELCVMAEQVLVEVLGRIREEHWAIVLPPLFDVPGADRPAAMRRRVNQHARDDALVPDLLAGRPTHVDHNGDLLGDDPHATLTRLADAACAAARQVSDGDVIVRADDGALTARDYLTRLTVARSFLAHDVAMHLGSRACPLTEELARGLWEGPEPAAPTWRSRGIFRDPSPMPADVSWRDRFLLSAGRDPHPLH